MDHDVPFHTSDKAVSTPATLAPTATQALDEVQATPMSSLSCETPLELAVAWMDHELRFDTSARVTATLELSMDSPTAVQAVVGLHDTPVR
jgi:hypothetical protein